jgi:signal transduction histidine kinase
MYVWNLDLQAKRIDFSRSLQKTDHSESIADYIESLCEGHREQARAVMAEKVRSGQPFTAIHHFRYTLVNTAPCWYAISGLPLKEKDGTVKHYFGLIRDITYMMEVQQKLREETDRAEHSGMLKSAFLANMTHEIRTPLNAIVGFSGLLQMIDTPDDRKEFIRIIRNNCDMLLRLINDILEASNMGQSMTIDPEEIDFAPVFDDICQTLEQRVSESGVPFQKDNPYQSLVVTLDKGRVQQILTNFVTNAVKYTKQGHIRVGYRQEQGELYFYCEDTGTGIPKDKLEAVFERFVKLNDYVQGTGLGLSICKAIVEKCGGRIGVDSEVGKGSTFWFRIPCQQS